MALPTMSEVVKQIVDAFDTSITSAQDALQTHHQPSWLDRAEAYVSHAIGVIFLVIRLLSAAVVFMWTAFMFVLPLGLGTAILVFISETASRRMWP